MLVLQLATTTFTMTLAVTGIHLSAAAAAVPALGLEFGGNATTRSIFATVSTLNGTSPPFLCDAATATLVYRPLAASAASARLHSAGGGGHCWLAGAGAVGEYVLSPGEGRGKQLVVKAIDLGEPVRNLGGATVFTESWASQRLQDGDTAADTWHTVNTSDHGCDAATAPRRVRSGTGSLLGLDAGCGVRSVPHEVRTFNFFRHPMTLTVDSVRVSVGAARIALVVPA